MALRLLASTATKVIRQSRHFVRSSQPSVQLSTTCFIHKDAPVTIPTDLEQATGIERKEIDAILAGNPDPFNLNVQRGAPGTRDTPTLVPSMYDERIIGCVCEEESTSITWMVLKQNETQRCAKCGNCFHLVKGSTNALADD